MRVRSWRLFAAGALAAVLVSTLGVGFAQKTAGEAGTVRYMVAAGSPFSVAVLKRLDEFESQTGIKVEVVELPYEQTLPKSIIEARNKTGAYDVIQINRPSLAALADRGLLMPLGDYVSQDVIDDLYPVHRDYGTFNGKLYAVPHSNDLRALYYRTDLFEQAGIAGPPTTWDELLADAQKLNDPANDVYGLIIAGSPKGPGVWVLSDFIHQAGGQILDENGQVAFNDDAGVKALQFMTDLVRKYKVSPPGTADFLWSDTRNLFAQGRGAMVIEFNDIIPLLEGPDSRVAGKYDLALLPSDVRGGTNNAGWMLGIPQGAKNPEAAGKLIDWIMSPDIQMHMSRVSGTLSGRKSVIDALISTGKEGLPTGDVNGKARWEFYRQVIGTTYELPRSPQEPDIENALGEALSSALSGAQQPAQALDVAAQRVKDILDQ